MMEKRQEPGFNLIYDTYDNVKILRNIAEQLVARVELVPGQRVLDTACGTGWATIAVARAVGEKGRVTGVDIADKMLDVARKKTAAEGLSNVDYCVGDAGALDFSENSFDAVICASSIFFLQDIPQALREWRRVLKAGGRLAFTSFGVDFMQPLARLFNERLARYDKQENPGPSPVERTDTVEKCRGLLERAGFARINVATVQLGVYLQDTEAYWKMNDSSIIKLRLKRLGPDNLEKFKAEHLAEVEALRTDKGIWMAASVHFSLAEKQ